MLGNFGYQENLTHSHQRGFMILESLKCFKMRTRFETAVKLLWNCWFQLDRGQFLVHGWDMPPFGSYDFDRLEPELQKIDTLWLCQNIYRKSPCLIVKPGKPSINGPFSIAILVYRRVFGFLATPKKKQGPCTVSLVTPSCAPAASRKGDRIMATESWRHHDWDSNGTLSDCPLLTQTVWAHALSSGKQLKYIKERAMFSNPWFRLHTLNPGLTIIPSFIEMGYQFQCYPLVI